MNGIFSVLSGGIWKFVTSWVLPALVAVAIFAFAVFPAIDHLPFAADLKNQTEVSRGFVLAFSVLVLAVLLATSATHIYRLLEGYSWPEWAKKAGISRQRQKWNDLNNKLDVIERNVDLGHNNPAVVRTWERGLLIERLLQFPETESDLMPTRLGNAFKALENYGPQRYRLGSQTLWSELTSAAPESIRDDIDNARGVIDFFVSLLCSAALLAFTAGVVALSTGHMPSLVIAVMALLSLPVSYRMAVASTAWYRTAMQSLVNIGRIGLAREYGLRMPATLEEERRMWEALTGFVIFGNDAYMKRLDEYRAPFQELDKEEAESN